MTVILYKHYTTFYDILYVSLDMSYRPICITKESDELHHSIGSPIDGAHPGPKTNRDYLGRYCPWAFETAKGKKECCDKLIRFFRNHKHTQQLSPTYQPICISW